MKFVLRTVLTRGRSENHEERWGQVLKYHFSCPLSSASYATLLMKPETLDTEDSTGVRV